MNFCNKYFISKKQSFMMVSRLSNINSEIRPYVACRYIHLRPQSAFPRKAGGSGSGVAQPFLCYIPPLPKCICRDPFCIGDLLPSWNGNTPKTNKLLWSNWVSSTIIQFLLFLFDWNKYFTCTSKWFFLMHGAYYCLLVGTDM